jgi:hypothetical protein
MNANRITERNAVKFVAKLSPWLAPIPSAYFVGRSSMIHLGLPLSVACIVAAIVETLGLASVHTALWFSDWNATKRKTDPTAPTVIALALGVVYLVTTLGLIVALEVWPGLATYAPALFPFLAVVGTVNLALIASQERREAAVVADKAEARQARQAAKLAKSGNAKGTPTIASVTPTAKRGDYLAYVALQTARNGDGPLPAKEAAAKLGVPLRTVYNWQARMAQEAEPVRLAPPIVAVN